MRTCDFCGGSIDQKIFNSSLTYTREGRDETATPIHTGWTKDICPDCSMRLLAKTRATAVALEEITKIAKDGT